MKFLAFFLEIFHYGPKVSSILYLAILALASTTSIEPFVVYTQTLWLVDERQNFEHKIYLLICLSMHLLIYLSIYQIVFLAVSIHIHLKRKIYLLHLSSSCCKPEARRDNELKRGGNILWGGGIYIYREGGGGDIRSYTRKVGMNLSRSPKKLLHVEQVCILPLCLGHKIVT